ncbi:HAMP domain-containing sensor histidine kinase [Chryseobacterium sp.]|uniref:sensor histidine kinase n=1 Tax=Chryseobacterium sp. TaxID=1871047 RepID=UPI0025C44513|nr:HAMP domain-containing sensor histidine kinase [Chryseobacterium sp.]
MVVYLKNYTLKYLLISLFLLIAVWAGLFYAFILEEVYDNVDDGLKNQKIEIIREAYSNPEILDENREFGINQFRITPIPKEKFVQKDELKNEMIFMPYDNEEEPYRVLTTHFFDKPGNAYELVIYTSTIEEDDLIYNLLTALIVLYILLIASIYATNQIVLSKAFKPLKKIVSQLEQYRFGEKINFKTIQTPIKEFNDLSTGITQMLEDNQETFLQQKGFIENASHELKTPINIIQNKLDWMIENEELDENNLNQLVEIKKTTKRMSDLVNSLLMLSKIENRQFQNESEVNANEIINNIQEEIQEWLLYKDLNFTLNEYQTFNIYFNKHLLQVLLNNLIFNAIKYTPKKAYIQVDIHLDKIIISNTSSDGNALDKNKIFKRFYKKGEDQSSTGLGLSIVQSIINKSNCLTLDYYFKDHRHYFTLNRKNS